MIFRESTEVQRELVFVCRVLIEDLQAQIEAQMDGPAASARAHSYTKYNSWDTVRPLLMHSHFVSI